jgi:hypothetical protein
MHRITAFLDDEELRRARVYSDRARHAAILTGQQPRCHTAVGDQKPRPAQLAIECLLHRITIGHRQHIAANVVHLLDGEIAVLGLGEPDAVAVQLLDDRKTALGIFIDGLLVDDASLAFSAAIGPAVPPPITSTSQETSDRPSMI